MDGWCVNVGDQEAFRRRKSPLAPQLRILCAAAPVVARVVAWHRNSCAGPARLSSKVPECAGLSCAAADRHQVGLAEMKMAVELTGGMTVQTDTFTNPVFRDSFKRVFAKPGEDGHMAIASNATFEVTAGPASMTSIP